MVSQPLVSVVMPAYNHKLYVKEAIQSIIKQTYVNIELIIIDDGSRDETWNIIQSTKDECEERFVRTVMKTRKNKGTCRTLNELISLCKGKYVAVIASDDKFLPTAISSMVPILETRNDAVLVVGRNLFINEKSEIVQCDKELNFVNDTENIAYKDFTDFLHKTRVRFDSPEWGTYAALVQGNHIPNGYLIKKATLDTIPDFSIDAPLEDFWLMLQLSKKGKLLNINNKTFLYRFHATNTVKNTKLMHTNIAKTLQWEDSYLKQMKMYDKLKQLKDAQSGSSLLLHLPFICNIYLFYYLTERKIILRFFNHDFILFRWNKTIT